VNAITEARTLALVPPITEKPLLICFSHLRWDFVWQRPQQLLTRATAQFAVVFVEEPVFIECASPTLTFAIRERGVIVVVPNLAHGTNYETSLEQQRSLLKSFLNLAGSRERLFWYYTPMALGFSSNLRREVTVYDKMDELAAFFGAPPQMRAFEDELLLNADVVFAGGTSLFDATRGRREDVHLLPSSVDVVHFNRARELRDHLLGANREKSSLTLGFFGVIDERMDVGLLESIARLRPNWRIELIGPVVKIDPSILPRLPNISWAGPCNYRDLPERLARWDVGIMPFALNDATRHISPTKTPEFLAAGLPVVSTPIVDVIRTYGEAGLVRIAATAEEFVQEIEGILRESRVDWLRKVDVRLAMGSWDATWRSMVNDIRGVRVWLESKKRRPPQAQPSRRRPASSRLGLAGSVEPAPSPANRAFEAARLSDPPS
jgi:glycosyltransferase involved in cell wall biosynthesis